MYFVIYGGAFGHSIQRFEDLEVSKECVKKLYSQGKSDVLLTQNIPMKINVTVEF
ncbi:hypothetical protein [Bacillus sp. 1P06AnD]|uniref:hypothetical protein n=1 Tax=Bacillus sp. 1P06AnD TaxID=3132208 RepID=UPI0039A07C2E